MIDTENNFRIKHDLNPSPLQELKLSSPNWEIKNWELVMLNGNIPTEDRPYAKMAATKLFFCSHSK